MAVWLFALGAAIGSFINVLAVRYDPERFILSLRIIGGRSHCPKCGKKLTWLELIPLVSFAIQLGRCRECKKKISPQYPIVEILSGLIFVFVPKFFMQNPLHASPHAIFLSVAWVLAFLTLLLISLIDMRTNIIPDEANIFLAILGIIIAFSGKPFPGEITGSFLGSYALVFDWGEGIALNRILAVFAGILFFGALILITRGRGMGMGDLKLAAALGFVFGWPDIALLIGLSFVIGSLFAGVAIVFRRKGMKSFLPFGPFLAIASGAVFFLGFRIVDFYFKLFRL